MGQPHPVLNDCTTFFPSTLSTPAGGACLPIDAHEAPSRISPRICPDCTVATGGADGLAGAGVAAAVAVGWLAPVGAPLGPVWGSAPDEVQLAAAIATQARLHETVLIRSFLFLATVGREVVPLRRTTARDGHARLTRMRAEPTTVLIFAARLVGRFVDHSNGVRLHSALGYIAPNDLLAGRSEAIWAERDRKLEAARERRRERRDQSFAA